MSSNRIGPIRASYKSIKCQRQSHKATKSIIPMETNYWVISQTRKKRRDSGECHHVKKIVEMALLFSFAHFTDSNLSTSLGWSDLHHRSCMSSNRIGPGRTRCKPITWQPKAITQQNHEYIDGYWVVLQKRWWKKRWNSGE
jgi:hypothetical protein